MVSHRLRLKKSEVHGAAVGPNGVNKMFNRWGRSTFKKPSRMVRGTLAMKHIWNDVLAIASGHKPAAISGEVGLWFPGIMGESVMGKEFNYFVTPEDSQEVVEFIRASGVKRVMVRHDHNGLAFVYFRSSKFSAGSDIKKPLLLKMLWEGYSDSGVKWLGIKIDKLRKLSNFEVEGCLSGLLLGYDLKDIRGWYLSNIIWESLIEKGKVRTGVMRYEMTREELMQWDPEIEALSETDIMTHFDDCFNEMVKACRTFIDEVVECWQFKWELSQLEIQEVV